MKKKQYGIGFAYSEEELRKSKYSATELALSIAESVKHKLLELVGEYPTQGRFKVLIEEEIA